MTRPIHRARPFLGGALLLLGAACAAPRAGTRALESSASTIRAAAPAAASTALIDSLDARVPALLAQHRVPSIAVAYIEDGRVAWTRVYGEQAPGVPATPQTLYNVASLTKPVFAEVMLQLAAKGQVALDESMATHWVDPDIAADPRHRLLTPRMALSHRIGFPNWRPAGGPLRFEWEPNSGYHYSGEGFQYLLHFAERKLGTTLDSLAHAHVFAPFGMRSTAFTRQPWFEGRLALPADKEGRFLAPHRVPAPGDANAADLLHTTVGDYATFVVGAMHRTALPAAIARQRDSIHSPDAQEAEHCRGLIGAKCADRFGYGLGWSILEYPGFTVRWHTGSDAGHKAMMYYFPERRRGAVMLTNGDNGFAPMIDVAILLSAGTPFVDFLHTGK